MPDVELQNYKGGRGQKATFDSFKLDTLENTRKTFAKIIEEYGTGGISENMGRALTYMLAQYLNYWKLEKELDIEERLEAVEELYEKERKR